MRQKHGDNGPESMQTLGGAAGRADAALMAQAHFRGSHARRYIKDLQIQYKEETEALLQRQEAQSMRT